MRVYFRISEHREKGCRSLNNYITILVIFAVKEKQYADKH